MSAGTHRRACDVCGDDSWRFNQLTYIGNDKYACPYDARGFHDADLEGLDPIQLKPSVESRPGDEVKESSIIELWQQSEAIAFNWVVTPLGQNTLFSHNGANLPGQFRHVIVENGGKAAAGIGNLLGGFGTGPDLYCIGWTCNYLYGVIAEDRRPKVWIDRAKTVLGWHADYLLQRQFGSPTADSQLSSLLSLSYTAGPNDTEYGGFLDGNTPTHLYAEQVGLCGLALLRAYQVHGLRKYQEGYQRALTCLRRMQRMGSVLKRHYVNSSTDINARWNPGMFAYRLLVWNDAGTRRWYPDNELRVSDLVCLEFIKAAKDLEGDTTYGDTTAVGDMVSATAATLSEMADQAKAFWTDGTFDSSYEVHVRPLPLPVSPGGPFHDGSPRIMDSFFPYSVNQAGAAVIGDGYFSDSSQADVSRWVYAIRGLHAYYGYDSTVQSLWEFFSTATSNASNAVPDNTPPLTLFQNHYGASDQKLCWPQVVEVASTYRRVSSPDKYEWTSVGLLASLWRAREPAKFAEAKRLMVKPLRMYFRGTATGARDAIWITPMELGLTGFSMQPLTNQTISGKNVHEVDIQALMQCALVFREQPRIFNLRDH